MRHAMFKAWRLPKLDRIGNALAEYETCRCRDCRRKVLHLIDSYDRAKH